MPSSLKDFFLNEVMRNDVKIYLIDYLKTQAIEKAFAKEDINGIAEAKEVLDKAFSNLEILFEPEHKGKEPINEARQFMKQIKLTQNKYAIVDNEDFEKLNQYKWFFSRCRNSGYAWRWIRKNGKRICVSMQRDVLNYFSKNMVVDHINRNPLDNRKNNLRVCSNSQNCNNSEVRQHNKTGLKGVHVHKSRYLTSWIAQIQKEGKKMYLGSFPTPEEAHEAYKQRSQKLFGNFALAR